MSEHHDVPKNHEPHALHEEHTKGPHDPNNVTGDQLHEAIRAHGTHVEKVRASLHHK
jgi:Protein of unknown function (DUF3606)